MAHRLYIVEGLPCTGKSTTARYIASLLKGDVRCVDEGTGEHPADYEWHALDPATGRVTALAGLPEAEVARLLPHKIYDGLPWETEAPLMLEKWRAFAAQAEATHVFNCVLLQNPLCETMMRFDLPEEETRRHVAAIAEIIRPLSPMVIYLQCSDIAAAVRSAAEERPGWLEAVIAYHTQGAYGRRTGAAGFEGYVACLEARQAREMRVLPSLGIDYAILPDARLDWPAAREALRGMIPSE